MSNACPAYLRRGTSVPSALVAVKSWTVGIRAPLGRVLLRYVSSTIWWRRSAQAFCKFDEGLGHDIGVEVSSGDIGVNVVGLQLAGFLADGAVPVSDYGVGVVGDHVVQGLIVLGNPIAAAVQIDHHDHPLWSQGI